MSFEKKPHGKFQMANVTLQTSDGNAIWKISILDQLSHWQQFWVDISDVLYLPNIPEIMSLLATVAQEFISI